MCASQENRCTVHHKETSLFKDPSATVYRLPHLVEVLLVLLKFAVFRTRVKIWGRREYQVDTLRRHILYERNAVPATDCISQRRGRVLVLPRDFTFSPLVGFLQQTSFENVRIRASSRVNFSRVGVDDHLTYSVPLCVAKRYSPDMVTVIHFWEAQSDNLV